jgi:hypothetical protein
MRNKLRTVRTKLRSMEAEHGLAAVASVAFAIAWMWG